MKKLTLNSPTWWVLLPEGLCSAFDIKNSTVPWCIVLCRKAICILQPMPFHKIKKQQKNKLATRYSGSVSAAQNIIYDIYDLNFIYLNVSVYNQWVCLKAGSRLHHDSRIMLFKSLHSWIGSESVLNSSTMALSAAGREKLCANTSLYCSSHCLYLFITDWKKHFCSLMPPSTHHSNWTWYIWNNLKLDDS